jgi:hypothetical protein
MIMKNYLPATEGAGYELTPTLSVLAPLRDQFLVLSNLACVPTPGRPGGAHAKASTRFLTDVSPPTSETFLDAGIEPGFARRRRDVGQKPGAGFRVCAARPAGRRHAREPAQDRESIAVRRE